MGKRTDSMCTYERRASSVENELRTLELADVLELRELKVKRSVEAEALLRENAIDSRHNAQFKGKSTPHQHKHSPKAVSFLPVTHKQASLGLQA